MADRPVHGRNGNIFGIVSVAVAVGLSNLKMWLDHARLYDVRPIEARRFGTDRRLCEGQVGIPVARNEPPTVDRAGFVRRQP